MYQLIIDKARIPHVSITSLSGFLLLTFSFVYGIISSAM